MKITIIVDAGVMQHVITMIPDEVPEKAVIAGAFMVAIKKGEVSRAKLALSMQEDNFRVDEDWYRGHCNVPEYDPNTPLFAKTPMEQAIARDAAETLEGMKRVKKRAVRGLTLLRPQPITDEDGDRGDDCGG
jgi:hypothetical protein